MRAPKPTQVPLPKHPQYAAFVQRYANDLPRFCVEVCGITPTWQQLEFMESLQRPGSRTSVASGHGTGKTQIFAVAVWWHLTCYPMSNTILSAPKLDVVLSGVRKYAADIHSQVQGGKFGWIADYVVIVHKSIYIRGYKAQWWCAAKTAPAGKPEAMAGEHRKFLLWLLDESSGIDDAVFGVILGSLTEEWNRIALASQGTRASGVFYDTHHKLSERRGGVWRTITMNSEESPLVSDAFIEEKLKQYGGRDDPQYQIKVRGIFPDKLEGQLLARAQLERCLNRRSCIPVGADWGWLLLVDVAAGEFRDKSVVVQAKVSGYGQHHEARARRMHVQRVPIMSNRIQPTELVGRIVELQGLMPRCTILVDCGGLGLSVYKRLVELGLTNVVKVLWGDHCWRTELQESYFNQRAHAMVSMAKAAQHDQLTFEPGCFNSQADETEFLDQHRVPYHFDDKARYVIASKGSKEWGSLPSPDCLDSVSFGFLEGARYVPVDDNQAAEEAASVGDAVRRMRERMAALAQELEGEGAEGA